VRVHSSDGLATDYNLKVRFDGLPSRTQTGARGGGAGGRRRPGAVFDDPRIESIFRKAVEEFAAPLRRETQNRVAGLKAERDRLEQEKRTLIESRSAELRGQVHGMLDQVKRDQQGNVEGIANNIKGGIDWAADGAINLIGGLIPDWVFNIPFVGGWIRDRFNSAKDSIWQAINGARNWLKARIDDVKNTINGAISWFIDRVKDAYFTAGEANLAIEGIAREFRSKIEDAIGVLNGTIGTFKGMILGSLEWTRNIGAGGWNLFDHAIVGLVNNLTNGAQDTVRNTGRFFMDRVTDVERGVQWVIGEIGNLLGDETGRIYNQYQDQIRAIDNRIDAITNETENRIRAKEAQYKADLERMLNQLGREGKEILDTILNFANSPEGQISIAVLEVALGLIPGVGQVIDIKDTVLALIKIINGDLGLETGVELTGALAGWIPAVGDTVKSIAKLAIGGALTALLAKLGPDVVQAASKALKEANLGKRLGDALAAAKTKLSEVINTIKNSGWIYSIMGKQNSGFELAVQTANTIVMKLDDVAAKADDLVTKGTQNITSQSDEFVEKAAKEGVGGSLVVVDWTVGKQAKSLLANGTKFSGIKLPDKASPNAILYKVGTDGNISNYSVYNDKGLAIKRVDLTGTAHNSVPTPHVVDYKHNQNPTTGEVFVNRNPDVRPARPEEIP